MVEKVITLENISLLEFLGVDNNNIKEISNAFPESKIIARGNEIRIQGSTPEIIRINQILQSLLNHFNKYGALSKDQVKTFIHEEEDTTDDGNDEVLIYGTRGLRISAKTPNQKKLIAEVSENDLVFAVGPAGTGKTYISVALAVKALKNKTIKKIIITRPAVEAGENLGFLPGDLKEKIDPYLRPIYDALGDMIPSEKLKYYQENGIIEIAPLAYMRGRTLNHAFVLLDEAQNTTPMQMKMFLTRMGPDSKVIVNGDKSQIDLPNNQKSGLIDAINVLKKVAGISFIELDDKDVVRHRLVRSIVNAYGSRKDS
ncbi:MAG: PhoH family protein [Bacteroidetes bacterium]|nr:PhoH family protein [Bacteroidota bacterium]MDA1119336.1 PhoH family protein [Bacteroidota bacterium]